MSERVLSYRFHNYSQGRGYEPRPLVYKTRLRTSQASQQSLDGVRRTITQPLAPTSKTTRVAPAETKPTKHFEQVFHNAGPAQNSTKRRFSVKGALATASAGAVLLFGGYVLLSTLKANKAIETQVNNGVLAASSEGPDVDETPVDKTAVANYRVAPDMPRVIRISKIGVEARVLRVGVTADGAIDTPKNVFDTGWYDGSSKPGTNGAALIVGHYSGRTTDGVFEQLKKLVKGDEIEIEKGDGSKLTYRVVDKKQFSADNIDLASTLTPVKAGKPGLNLITCGGKFDDKTDTFTDRTVVYTEQI